MQPAPEPEKIIQDLQNPREQDARQWGMLVHFSIFAGYIAPIIGLVLPIILWQIKKDQYPSVDVHGKIVTNWLLSAIIYTLVCIALSFVVIGLLGFVVLAILSVVYPIIGGIKGNNGEFWPYPLSIRFFK